MTKYLLISYYVITNSDLALDVPHKLQYLFPSFISIPGQDYRSFIKLLPIFGKKGTIHILTCNVGLR